jgi:hypothetical protein
MRTKLQVKLKDFRCKICFVNPYNLPGPEVVGCRASRESSTNSNVGKTPMRSGAYVTHLPHFRTAQTPVSHLTTTQLGYPLKSF